MKTSPANETALSAYALLAFTTLCWGGNAVMGRLAVGEISPMLLVCLRWLGCLLLLMMFARQQVRRDWRPCTVICRCSTDRNFKAGT